MYAIIMCVISCLKTVCVLTSDFSVRFTESNDVVCKECARKNPPYEHTPLTNPPGFQHKRIVRSNDSARMNRFSEVNLSKKKKKIPRTDSSGTVARLEIIVLILKD